MPPDDFRKAVKHRLIDLDKSQAWLCEEITARTGRFCDNSTIKRILDGRTKRSPIIQAIMDILDMSES